ncbi:hypothetical protein CK203_083674 [Vitis vinifera]|uniref:Uncharacterized protein n=1 Tax=Vitis vinifera TaxID=29760 RepID=A0A438CYF0_VITVI|nr:hypothetical protein CK203_083674 [Vitis vinifera]
MVDSRRRRNFMVAVRVNGTWLFKDADIKEGNADSRSLEVPFLEEGVFSTLFNLSGVKALRLDGFTMAFW